MVRLNATTLIESMIAMVLFGIIICISSITFVNSVRSSKVQKRFELMLLVNNELKNENILDEFESNINGVKIKKTISKYLDYDDISLVEFCVLDDEGDTLFIQNALISTVDE